MAITVLAMSARLIRNRMVEVSKFMRGISRLGGMLKSRRTPYEDDMIVAWNGCGWRKIVRHGLGFCGLLWDDFFRNTHNFWDGVCQVAANFIGVGSGMVAGFGWKC